MGKTLPNIETWGEYAEHEGTISRDRLKSFVDTAIEFALERFPSDGAKLSPESLRNVAATTNEIDFNSWKCADSCGCPLTAAGRVTLDHSKPGDILPDVYAAFYQKFDKLMSDEFSVEGPTTVEVI